MGIFSKLKSALKKTSDAVSFKINKLFTGGALNEDFYEELEAVLLSSDIGATATERILDELKECVNKNRIKDRGVLKDYLRGILEDILTENGEVEFTYPCVVLIAGVNGVGKTTAVGKLAKYFTSMGKTVTVAAADTFRAAASDQLTVWAERANVRIIKHAEGADPAAVVYDAVSSAKSKGTDVLLVDTAGRLHNKKNLMEELKKIDRVARREYPEAQILNLLVLDATTGQNAIAQVDIFNEAITLDGIILNKLDGTAKGGVILAISSEYSVPVVFAGVGEAIDDLEPFNPADFVSAII